MEVQVRMKVGSLCDISTKWMEEPITGGFRRTAEEKLGQAVMYICCNCLNGVAVFYIHDSSMCIHILRIMQTHI